MRPGGSGGKTAELVDTCIDAVFTKSGLVANGWLSDGIGIYPVATTSTTACMAAHVILGAFIVALVCTCTAAESYGETVRDAGAKCVPIGTCGNATTTTEGQGGSGEKKNALDVIFTGYESFDGGMEHAGCLCEHTGILFARTTTSTDFMVNKDGVGGVSGESACTGTVFEFSNGFGVSLGGK